MLSFLFIYSFICLFIVTFLPGLLTKKFINLLQGAENGTLDLNKAAEMLEVWYFALSSGS
jgi:hypothetical protein